MSVAEQQQDLIINDVNVSQHVATIKEQGYTVIPDFLGAEQVTRLRRAFATEVPMTEMRAIGVNTGKSLRAHNLLAKTRAADYIFLDPRLRAIVDGVIGPLVQVNVTTLFNLLPGETKQFLHQDDGLWPIPRPHPSFLCNALVALDDFDEENGATHLVPYSHLWHDRSVEKSEETTRVCMPSGSMVMWEGAMWHAGGANVTGNRERLGLFISHVVSYLAPQEPQLISIPRGVVREMPRKLQRLVGYQKFSGIGGEVDFRDPIDVLEDSQVVHPQAKIGSSGFGRL